METNFAKMWVIAGGVFNLAFAIFHFLFWRLFRWKQDLPKLAPVNRAIMQVLNIRLIYVLIGFAYISFFFTNELTSTRLGREILLFIAVFWIMRAGEQKIFFELRNRVSIALFIFFLCGGIIYLLPLIY
ncbi:hypothetical protein GF337_07990 [candidate division KSB1 bacterium]|nr:hypothetical protein [candidate division KSB1 bacterium]